MYLSRSGATSRDSGLKDEDVGGVIPLTAKSIKIWISFGFTPGTHSPLGPKIASMRSFDIPFFAKRACLRRHTSVKS